MTEFLASEVTVSTGVAIAVAVELRRAAWLQPRIVAQGARDLTNQELEVSVA